MVQASARYGKANVSFYRTYAAPLAGLRPIPESAFTGRANILFTMDVDVEVTGDAFLRAYTEGDNSAVVATDTMKNFLLDEALAYDGATLEGFLWFLGRRMLASWPQMQGLRLTGRELPFAPATVPHGDGTFVPSSVLFARDHNDHAVATLELVRNGEQAAVTAHTCGRAGMQLIKITGSSFTRFVRDQHTTLAEAVDRPLYIHLDVGWVYRDVHEALGLDATRYIAAEQVRDVVMQVFHSFVSRSIQHLVHEMGQRLLDRFPAMVEVSFAAQNRLWDTAAVSGDGSEVKVYCDPRPPYGVIGLTLRRDQVG